MLTKRVLTEADILPLAEYAKSRKDWRTRISVVKRNRRTQVGPYITFYFECWEAMWPQVQEMMYIEKGGMEQVPGELEAYNPLIPNGSELIATFMVEIDDPIRRKWILDGLGGVEETAFIRVGKETIRGIAEADQDRTTAEGKASSVQFVHFPFTPDQIAAFGSRGAVVVLGFSHPNYGHMTVLPEAVRAQLTGDFG
jgi:hypothetical protein